MKFSKDNLKLKLVEGFTMPESEFIKGEGGAKGSFRKTGGETPMYKLTFVEQDEFKNSISFNKKVTPETKKWVEDFEDTDELVIVEIELSTDAFTHKLKTPNLTSVNKQ